MSNFGLVVCDLDGTLVNSDKNNYIISPELKNKIQEIRKYGIEFTIATGRPEYSSMWVVKELDIKIPFIAYNGGMILDAYGKVIFESKFPINKWLKYLEIIDKLGGTILIYFDGYIHYYRKTNAVEIYEKKEKTTCIPLNKHHSLTKEVNKILLIGDSKFYIKIWEKELSNELKNNFHYFTSEHNYVEILEKNISKGHALKILKNHLKIPNDAVIGIGNQMNDKELLEEAHIGVAVQNAEEKLKLIADKVTTKTYENGVIEAMNNIIKKVW